MSSVKENVVLNGINAITGILFPVITFPYAARVLLPEGIGSVNFLNSIIGYIVLFTSLGIPMYAVREVAKYRDDKLTRDKITVEILILSVCLCLMGYVAVWLLARCVPQIHQQSALFYILSLTIVFTTIGVNWFYQGIEDFKFITIRAVVIRALSAIALFLFVHKSSDLLIYGMIIVGSTVGNNIINFVHLRKHVDCGLVKLADLNIVRHVKPALQVFVLNLIISLYIQLSTIMLGFMAGEAEVGYYAAGTRITQIALTIISSLGAVMLPRCSHLLKIGDKDAFDSVIRKSLDVTIALAMPMMVGLMLLAKPVVVIFCGTDFMPSIPVLYLNAPVILFISLTNMMGIQILYPMDKINIVIASVSGGAVSDLMLNFILIPLMGATGAAVATFIAEFIVLAIQIILGHKAYPFSVRDLFVPRYIVSAIAMGGAVWAITLGIHTMAFRLVIGLFTGVSVYLVMLLWMKDSLLMEMLGVIRNKIRL